MRDAAQLRELGRVAVNAGRLERARRLLTLALDQADSAEERARCLVTLSMVEAEQGDLAAGIGMCTEALKTSALPREVQGLIHSQLGLLRVRVGDVEGALQELTVAEQMLTDRAALARLHLNRGNLYTFLDRPPAAAFDFQRAMDLSDNEVTRAKAQHNLATVELRLGNPVTALRMMEQADAVLDVSAPGLRAMNEFGRALALAACGLPNEAADMLAASARSYARARNWQDQGEAHLERARILLLIDPVAAVRAAGRAVALFERRGSRDWALRAKAMVFAARIARGKGIDAAMTGADELRAELVGKRLRSDAQLMSLWAASGALSGGDPAAARTWLGRTRIHADDPLPHRLFARELRARLAVDSGSRARALNHLRAGLDELHSWLSLFGSHDLQSSAVGHGRGLTRLGLDLADEDGRPEVVFEWAERSRVLNSRVAPARPPAGTAAELQELRDYRHGGAGDESGLQQRIRQHGWYTEAAGPAARPARLGDVQSALGDEDVLLSLAVARERLVALVITRSDADLVALGGLEEVRGRLPRLVADLETSASSDLPESLRTVVAGSLERQLAELGEQLLGPLGDLVDGRRLVLVPTGRVNGVPWSLLPVLQGRPLTVARSATHWLSLQSRPLSMARVGFARGPRLPHAAAEVEQSAAAWPAAVIDLSATAESIAAMAETVDVLHVAAHGHHEGDSPMFSGLELADGRWYGYDIDQLQHVPDVVVLSACEVGAATVRAHEYLVGLTTAWLHAGAQCVIASPLAVNDRTAALMLPVVHDQMAAGDPPAVALAAAMAATEHPAPFACYGRGW
ncbi:MAG: CHAT domain-containing protein [Nocardioides sp.]